MAGDIALLKRQRGFTIPELLVAVAIIVIMTGLVVPNWRSGEQSLALQRAASKLGQDARRTQELAMRAQAHTCASGGISGYGILFEQATSESYLIFAECNDTNAYEEGEDDIVETISLERGTQIASVSPSSSSSIVFIPPTPTIFINGDPGAASLQVILQSTDGASSRTVNITNKGVIDVD